MDRHDLSDKVTAENLLGIGIGVGVGLILLGLVGMYFLGWT
jgi:hypothetical protein